jgi:hypothetical protein
MPDAVKAILLAANVGRPLSDEHKAKLSAIRKGVPKTEEHKAKIAASKMGHEVSDEVRAKISLAEMGHHHSAKTRKKMSESRRGPDNNFWKGGITSPNTLIRNGTPYSDWRTLVFVRDDYTCQHCGQRGVSLEAHHMDCFADLPEKRLDVNNGVTLCRECHREFHKGYGRLHNRKWQVDEFLGA